MLKAGVLAGGELTVSDEGVPQGSLASPIFSNIVAHHVIDEWIEDTVKPLMKGSVKAFRYADDLVICCRYEEDAVSVSPLIGTSLSCSKRSTHYQKQRSIIDCFEESINM